MVTVICKQTVRIFLFILDIGIGISQWIQRKLICSQESEQTRDIDIEMERSYQTCRFRTTLEYKRHLRFLFSKNIERKR